MVKISIITTTFNASGTIRDCLDSVKGQKYGSVEHIVVDAASSDGTVGILEEYKKYLAKVVSEPDKGIYNGMNKGLKLATGDVIGILNGDDVYANDDILEKVAGVFEDESVDSCYGDLVYVKDKTKLAVGSLKLSVEKVREEQAEDFSPSFEMTEEGFAEVPEGPRSELLCSGGRNLKVVRYWKSGAFDPQKFYWGWMPPHPTFFVRRSVYEKYGMFNLELGTAADYELMLRFLVKHRISTEYLPEILIKMRSGGASNVTLQSRVRANRMDRKAWEVNGLKPHPWTLWLKPVRKVGQWFFRPK